MFNNEELKHLNALIDKVASQIAVKVQEQLSDTISHNDNRTSTNTPQIKFIDIIKASEYLGLSKSSMYKMNYNNEIPYYKPGGRIYYKISELDEWIEKRRIKTQEEIEIEAEKYM